MKISVTPVNPGLSDMLLKFVAELEHPRYTLVGTEGPNNATFIFDCDEDNPWTAVDGFKAALRRPPLGNVIFCQVVPYGMYAWPPLFDKDKYPKPGE